ncbi:MAG: glycosyltransferase [Desulfobacterales bacterium]|nr:glycosyltransferase [Desulfobacterales bacterium]
MKVMVYCQHIWGVGHFFRTLEICRALDKHDVLLVTGGPEVKAVLPGHVRAFRLPEILTDPDYSALFASDRGMSLETTLKTRQEQLLALFKKEVPDLFMVELYPFGRRAFRHELDPILKAVRTGALPATRVVCSLRDILVEKNDPAAYEARVVNALNRYFDALLVHSDPRVIRLAETFSRVNDIHIPVFYSGFVAPLPPEGARRTLRRRLGIGKGEKLIVASAGGGKIGAGLLEPLLSAVGRLGPEYRPHLYVFTGPFMPQAVFDRLQRRADGRVRIFRFATDFLSHLAAADLSVSMAGYNTCMNILATRVPALVRPYSQDREQGLRAKHLARLGALKILSDADMMPARMAVVIQEALSRKPSRPISMDLNGARNTAAWLHEWMQGRG